MYQIKEIKRFTSYIFPNEQYIFGTITLYYLIAYTFRKNLPNYMIFSWFVGIFTKNGSVNFF